MKSLLDYSFNFLRRDDTTGSLPRQRSSVRTDSQFELANKID